MASCASLPSPRPLSSRAVQIPSGPEQRRRLMSEDPQHLLRGACEMRAARGRLRRVHEAVSKIAHEFHIKPLGRRCRMPDFASGPHTSLYASCQAVPRQRSNSRDTPRFQGRNRRKEASMYPTRAGCPEKTLPFAAIAVGSYGIASAICDSDRARARARRPGRPPPARDDRAGRPRRPSANSRATQQRGSSCAKRKSERIRHGAHPRRIRGPRAPRYVAPGPL